MVLNCARYINSQLGTNIILDPDGQILEESSFTTATGEEVTIDQIKDFMVKYGEGMSKMFEVLGDVVVDSATAGIVNELSGSDPSITLTIS